MRLGLDTSVVLRLLIGEPQRLAERAWQVMVETRAAGGEIVVSDLVVSEAYFALQHHYAVPKAEAITQLRALFDSGDVVPTGSAAAVLALPGLATAKPGLVDRMIHSGYLDNADQILTFEKATRKLARTRVLKG